MRKGVSTILVSTILMGLDLRIPIFFPRAPISSEGILRWTGLALDLGLDLDWSWICIGTKRAKERA